MAYQFSISLNFIEGAYIYNFSNHFSDISSYMQTLFPMYVLGCSKNSSLLIQRQNQEHSNNLLFYLVIAVSILKDDAFVT